MDSWMTSSAMKGFAFALLPAACLLSGCESASRFAGGGSEAPRPVVAATPEPGIAAPTAPVSAEPLPPLAGAGPDQEASADEDAMATAPLQEAPAVPRAAAAPSSRSFAGRWQITDARGNCSITLTQQSLLDLYRASPSGCQAGSVAKVNAWTLRGQEIVLLEPGGGTAVRLFPKGDGTFEGANTGSGSIVRMTR